MTYKKLVLEFWKWIGFGALGFVPFFLIPILVQPLFCEPQQENNQWTAKGYYSPAQEKNGKQAFEYSATQKKQQTPKQHQANAAESDEYHLPAWFCDGTRELKSTDLALVFFTYALVIVGWFAMRSADETAKRTERAYIVCGGPFGKPKPETDTTEFFQKASNFTEPWRMALHNYGKTQAIVTGLKWGLCRKEAFPPREVLVSEIVKYPEKHLPPADPDIWILRTPENADESIPPNIGGIPYRHAEFPHDRKYFEGWVFFGMVDYKDVFGDKHHSTFKLLLKPEHSDPLPGCHSDDYS